MTTDACRATVIPVDLDDVGSKISGANFWGDVFGMCDTSSDPGGCDVEWGAWPTTTVTGKFVVGTKSFLSTLDLDTHEFVWVGHVVPGLIPLVTLWDDGTLLDRQETSPDKFSCDHDSVEGGWIV